MLKDTKLSHAFDIGDLAKHTPGFSGSDLKELCRNAAMIPMREFMREAGVHPELLAKAEDSVGLFTAAPSLFPALIPLFRDSNFDPSTWMTFSKAMGRVFSHPLKTIS